ncbi:MAG: hypothetical protein K1060chlam2_00530 [Chlamydiae bacterium]|nr:hypothetical protein [Chlamydiota bacterium]
MAAPVAARPRRITPGISPYLLADFAIGTSVGVLCGYLISPIARDFKLSPLFMVIANLASFQFKEYYGEEVKSKLLNMKEKVFKYLLINIPALFISICASRILRGSFRASPRLLRVWLTYTLCGVVAAAVTRLIFEHFALIDRNRVPTCYLLNAVNKGWPDKTVQTLIEKYRGELTSAEAEDILKSDYSDAVKFQAVKKIHGSLPKKTLSLALTLLNTKSSVDQLIKISVDALFIKVVEDDPNFPKPIPADPPVAADEEGLRQYNRELVTRKSELDGKFREYKNAVDAILTPDDKAVKGIPPRRGPDAPKKGLIDLRLKKVQGQPRFKTIKILEKLDDYMVFLILTRGAFETWPLKKENRGKGLFAGIFGRDKPGVSKVDNMTDYDRFGEISKANNDVYTPLGDNLGRLPHTLMDYIFEFIPLYGKFNAIYISAYFNVCARRSIKIECERELAITRE